MYIIEKYCLGENCCPFPGSTENALPIEELMNGANEDTIAGNEKIIILVRSHIKAKLLCLATNLLYKVVGGAK